jgi:hypothetical protein
MKSRITVRPLENNCHVILNGDVWAVIHKLDAKKGLMARVEELRKHECDWSADRILKCIRVA